MILKTKQLNNESWVSVYRRMTLTQPCWVHVATFTLDEQVFPDLEHKDKRPIDMAGLFAWQLDRKGSDALLCFHDHPGDATTVMSDTPEGVEPYTPNLD